MGCVYMDKPILFCYNGETEGNDGMKLTFEELFAGDMPRIEEMSALASGIVKEYYDPLLGAAQNDYMIGLFQSAASISEQLNDGKRYFFVRYGGEDIGFFCFYPHDDAMYLSKLYLRADMRGRGFARPMIAFISEETKKCGLSAIELNVNKHNVSKDIYERLGFVRIRSEKNDIGHGYYMDDYVYRLEIEPA